MRRTASIATSILLLVTAAAAELVGDPAILGLDVYVDRAAFVGRVRVEAAIRQTYEFEGERGSCGWVVQGAVVEALKGDARHVEFFTTLPEEIATKDEYLVFLSRYAFAPGSSRRSEDPPASTEDARSRCESAVGLLRVNDFPRVIGRFARSGERPGPGEWIMPSEISSILRATAQADGFVDWHLAQERIERASRANAE